MKILNIKMKMANFDRNLLLAELQPHTSYGGKQTSQEHRRNGDTSRPNVNEDKKGLKKLQI